MNSSKRKRTAVAAGALLISAACAGAYWFHPEPQHEPGGQVMATKAIANNPNENSEKRASLLGDIDAKLTSSKPALLAVAYTPNAAYSEAMRIYKCTSIADMQRPEGLTKEQQDEVFRSQLRGVDCKDLDERYTAYELVKSAAERGDIQAQVDFSGIAAEELQQESRALDPEWIRQYKLDSKLFLEQAAQSGSVEALQRLATSYSNGLFSDRDPIKAYAYALAYTNQVNSPLAQKRVDLLSQGLSQKELQTGQTLAQGLSAHN